MGFNLLLFIAFLLWAAWGMFLGPIVLANVIYKNDPEVVTLEVTCGSDRLTLAEEQSYARGGIGDKGDLLRFPLLRFNGQLVSKAWTGRKQHGLDPGLPVNPGDRANWLIKTYHSEPSDSDWTVYVNPAEFSRDSFDRLVACYETHRAKLDDALLNSTVKPWWTDKRTLFDARTRRIAHIIYHPQPEPKVFTTAHPRSGTLENTNPDYEKMIGDPVYVQLPSTETLTIQPNGKWQIYAKGEHGSHQWWGTEATGKVILQGETLVFQVDYLNPPLLDAAKQISDRDYFLAFVDNQGKQLTDYYQLGDLPPKYMP
jgi:hypothetical protein